MADTSTYDHRDPYLHTYNYFQSHHQQQNYGHFPLTLSSPAGALFGYNSFQPPPSPLYSSTSSSDYWYPSYTSLYGHLPPTPTSPFSSSSFSSYPSYPTSPTGGRGSGLPDVPDYLVSPRDAHQSSIPRAQHDLRQTPITRTRIRKASAKAVADMFPLPLSELPEEDRCCNICMEPYVEPRYSSDQPKKEHALRMPCGHVFGSFCIKEWLQAHNTCPACRTEVDYVEVEEEEIPSRSRGRRLSLSTHESIVNDLFGEPYRDTANRSRTPHQSTLRSHYFGSYEPEPRPDTTAQTHHRPSIKRAQTSVGQGSRHLPRFPFGQPPSPGLSRHASHARMPVIREPQYPRPGSSSSSAAATTQSEPTRGSSGHYTQAAASRGSSFRRPDLRCALEGLRLCDYDADVERPLHRLVRLDCGHGYHTDCLFRTMKSRGNGGDLSARLLWCERCRKYLGRISGE